MRVPIQLVNDFRERFQAILSQFAVDEKLLESPDLLMNDRFLTRSIVPHILKLSEMFNRLSSDPATAPSKSQSAGLEPYWKASSNPENLRLAYFLYFMPPNAFRVASVLSELGRLGFKWPFETMFRAIEFGAGPASGATGLIAGAPQLKLPREGEIALIEQDRSVLQLGVKWAERFATSTGLDWSMKPFHRKVDLKEPLLPRSAPQFQLWLSSFFLNEFSEDPELLLDRLTECWDRHLEENGLIILVEPALKLQSRRLLDLRRRLLERLGVETLPSLNQGPDLAVESKSKLEISRNRVLKDQRRPPLRGSYQIMLPCLGHQSCGALAAEEDWCHEEVTWWRPGYFRKIDDMAKLDRRTLPFSYLVISKTKKPLAELLPELGGLKTHRLVSPSHWEGRDQEFFLCGPEGKRRARYLTKTELGRGSILVNADLRGDAKASRVERAERIVPDSDEDEEIS